MPARQVEDHRHRERLGQHVARSQAGILYIPVSSPSPNFYGGNRKEKLPHATSLTALDAESGKVIWSRQLVHHDIWDYDTNSAPTLLDIHRAGKTIPALVQTTKQGFLFVLNRMTGEPIYPITERPVPQSDVPGEQASPTQPYVGAAAADDRAVARHLRDRRHRQRRLVQRRGQEAAL